MLRKNIFRIRVLGLLLVMLPLENWGQNTVVPNIDND